MTLGWETKNNLIIWREINTTLIRRAYFTSLYFPLASCCRILSYGRSTYTFRSINASSRKFHFSHFTTSIVLWFNLISFHCFQIKQKRGRPPKQTYREVDLDEDMEERESSPEDFSEARPIPKPKRNRNNDGAAPSASLKPTDQTMIGKLNTL